MKTYLKLGKVLINIQKDYQPFKTALSACRKKAKLRNISIKPEFQLQFIISVSEIGQKYKISDL